MRFIIFARMEPLQKMFLLLFVLCLSTSNADRVAFLDGSFLNPMPPETLSVDAFAALPSVLNDYPTPVNHVVGAELASLIVNDVFVRPFVTWNVVLFGAVHDVLFETGVPSVELTGDGTALKTAFLPQKPRMECTGACLVHAFREGMMSMGGHFTSFSGLHGSVSMDACGQAISIDDAALLLWATELGQLWNDLSTIRKNGEGIQSPLHLQSILTGLYLVRRVHGATSPQFASASCMTRETLMTIHRQLETFFNKGVFVSVLTHSNEAAVEDEAIEEAATSIGRQLLDFKFFSDNDPTKTELQKTQRFSTNAAGYVISLILWFSALGGVYVLCNMDFTKDTLLYSQAKVD